MADAVAEINKNLQIEIPYHSTGIYTNKEMDTIGDFMHQDFQHLIYGGPRDKNIIVEYPSENVVAKEVWKEILDKVLVPELESIAINLKREYKTIIRFTDQLKDPETKGQAGGIGLIKGKENWILVDLTDHNGATSNIGTVTMRMMHELIERDFWEKTSKNDHEAHVQIDHEADLFLKNGQEYRNLLDEKVTNRRSLRAIRRMWPNANWTDPDDIYEEDK